MSKIKNNKEKVENYTIKYTIKFLTRNNLAPTDFNIYNHPINKTITISKHLEKFIKKTSKILLIKHTSKLYKCMRNKKKYFLQKEKKRKKNLFVFCQKYNISPTEYSYEFVNLNINKYIGDFFIIAKANNKSPLIDIYDEFLNKINNNKSLFFNYSYNLLNSEKQNSQSNNNSQLINKNPIIKRVKEVKNIILELEEENENSFLDDINEFADQFINLPIEQKIIISEKNTNTLEEKMNVFANQYANSFIENINEFADNNINLNADTEFEFDDTYENSIQEDKKIFDEQFTDLFTKEVNDFADKFKIEISRDDYYEI